MNHKRSRFSLRRWRLALALCVALSGAASALDDNELTDLVNQPSIALYKAYAEFKMANYDDARRIWQALAARGVAESWFNLGILAEDGLGEAQDIGEALQRYERGARGGSSKAQYRLGLLYLEGRVVAADRARAAQWFEAAAAAGDHDAARQLQALASGADADPYLRARADESAGRLAEAAETYRRLSDAGNLRARTRLAWMLEAGRGVRRDLAQAADLFESAAQGGDAEAQYALSVMLRTGAGRPVDEAAAQRWLMRAAEGGYPEAIAVLRDRMLR